MNTPIDQLEPIFYTVFKKSQKWLISHLLDKWDGDFARFYLNLDDGLRRQLFDYYNIALEPERYPNIEA